MTREEAVKKARLFNTEYYVPLSDIAEVETFIQRLEALGLLKFDEPEREKELLLVIRSNLYENTYPSLNQCVEIANKYGIISLEEWPEGIVLWVGGEIKWKSWEDYFTPQDLYNKHLTANTPIDDKCISIFGYTIKELAKIIAMQKGMNK